MIALLCVSFVAVGGAVATLGPSLPGLARAIDRPLPDMGALLSVLFAGMLLGQVTAGQLVDRLGVRRPIVVSFVFFAAGVLVLPVVGSFRALLAGGLLMGVGFGMAAIGVNTLASRLMPDRPGFVLNLCNVWYACGTVAGPFLASLALARGGRAVSVLTLAGLLAAAVAPLAYWLVPRRATPLTPSVTRQPGTASASASTRWRPSPALVLIGVVVAFYGGVEAGFGGWAASYVQLTLHETAARGALLTSLFWFAYLVGRVAATVATLSIAPDRVLTATGVLVTLGGAVLGLGYGQELTTSIAIAILGFGIGPLYPAMFALVTSREVERPATAVSVASSIGSLGAVAFPWIMGQALPVADGRVVAWMPAGLGVGMMIAMWASERLYRAAAPAMRRD